MGPKKIRAAARNPSQAALAQDDKLASWPGGRRYTCPSYEMLRLGGIAVVRSTFRIDTGQADVA